MKSRGLGANQSINNNNNNNMAFTQPYDYNQVPASNDNFNSQKPPAVPDGYSPLPPPPAYIPLTGQLPPTMNFTGQGERASIDSFIDLNNNHHQPQYPLPNPQQNPLETLSKEQRRAILLVLLAKVAKPLFIIGLIAASVAIICVLSKKDPKKCPRGYGYHEFVYGSNGGRMGVCLRVDAGTGGRTS